MVKRYTVGEVRADLSLQASSRSKMWDDHFLALLSQNLKDMATHLSVNFRSRVSSTCGASALQLRQWHLLYDVINWRPRQMC